MLCPLGVVEVHSAAAVVVVELALLGVAGVGAVLDAGRFQSAQDGVEQLVADGEGVMVGIEGVHVGEVQGGRADAHDGERAGGSRS